MKKSPIAYCDYIATIIKDNLLANDLLKLLNEVGRVQFHIDSYERFSTMKTIDVSDMNGKEYRITIQEL